MHVLIADDHAVLRVGVKGIVRSLFPGAIIDEAADGNQALELLKNQEPDLLILDISLPGISGLDLLQSIKCRERKCRTLVLSCHPEDQYASRAFKLGAVGYIGKNAPFDELKRAISRVSEGGKYVSPEFGEKLAFSDTQGQTAHERLSEREFQVMLMMARGASVAEITSQAFISDKTVSTYRSRIMKKMNLKTNAELTMYAIKNGLIN